MNKKNICVVVTVITGIMILISCMPSKEKVEKDSLESLIANNNFRFHLKNPKTGSYAGSVENNKGNWTCSYGAEYRMMIFSDVKIEKNILYLSYLFSIFSLKGTPGFRDYVFPERSTVPISRKKIEDIIANGGYADDVNDSPESLPGYAHGLVITDSLRIRSEPKLESDILGKLNKFDDVFLVEESQSEDTIEGLTAHWYKVKMKDDLYGWVFGGFVKLYFYDEDKENIKNTFEKQGSEYTNLELHQDD